jgi:hypothetical protein
MKPRRGSILCAVIGIVAALAIGGCVRVAREGGGGTSTSASPRSPFASGPRVVVEEYLRAAARADGPGMYALIASSERGPESPKTLADTARDRYSTDTSWEILKVEEKGSTADVVVDIKRAKVDPNPYRFTLTREAGEWRIVQSPELHEEDKSDGIKIKLP